MKAIMWICQDAAPKGPYTDLFNVCAVQYKNKCRWYYYPLDETEKLLGPRGVTPYQGWVQMCRGQNLGIARESYVAEKEAPKARAKNENCPKTAIWGSRLWIVSMRNSNQNWRGESVDYFDKRFQRFWKLVKILARLWEIPGIP